jgi:hypothetical protein
VPPTEKPTATPFSAPVIAEPPAAPRQLPAAPVVVAPVVPRNTPTVAKPRNLETSKPEPPAASVATSTPAVRAQRTVLPTAVRQPTPAPTVRAVEAIKPTATPPPPPAPTATPVSVKPTAGPAGARTPAPR